MLASPALRRISARSSTVWSSASCSVRAIATTARTPARQARNSGRHVEALDLASDGLERHVGVEHHVGRLAIAARIEIHEQKGEVIQHVDGGQRLAELEGVERHGHVVDQHDVAEVQIAVAAAHAAGIAARDKEGLGTLEGGDETLGDVGMAIGQRARQLLDDGRQDACAIAVGGDGAVLMVARDHVGERAGKVVGERAALLAVTEHRVLREAAHVHRPFDDLPAAAEGKLAVVAHDRNEAEVDVGRVRPVDFHLAHGCRVTGVQRREVDEAQMHALAQLVGVIADEEYAGDVRLDDVDAGGARSIGRGIAQEGADLALLVVGERKYGVVRHGTCRLASVRAGANARC